MYAVSGQKRKHRKRFVIVGANPRGDRSVVERLPAQRLHFTSDLPSIVRQNQRVLGRFDQMAHEMLPRSSRLQRDLLRDKFERQVGIVLHLMISLMLVVRPHGKAPYRMTASCRLVNLRYPRPSVAGIIFGHFHRKESNAAMSQLEEPCRHRRTRPAFGPDLLKNAHSRLVAKVERLLVIFGKIQHGYRALQGEKFAEAIIVHIPGIQGNPNQAQQMF